MTTLLALRSMASRERTEVPVLLPIIVMQHSTWPTPKKASWDLNAKVTLNTFPNYRVEPGKTVTLTIEGNNRMTRLLVDGKAESPAPYPKPLSMWFAIQDRAHYQVEGASPYEPIVYQPTEKIN